MDLALNNLQRLICQKHNQPTNQKNNFLLNWTDRIVMKHENTFLTNVTSKESYSHCLIVLLNVINHFRKVAMVS